MNRPHRAPTNALAGICVLLAALALGACSTDQIPFVYRVDVEQGNVVDQNMIAQLEPGMSRDQVRFILGSPLLVDPFSDNRWDYIYTFSKGGKRREQRNLTVLFEDEALKRIIGDVNKASGPIALQDSTPSEVDVPPGSPRRNQGILARLFSSQPSEEELAAQQAARKKTQAGQAEDVVFTDETADETEEEAEERRERVREERRQDNQEKFYEELLDDLELEN